MYSVFFYSEFLIELTDSFDWASYLMEGIEYPTYSDSDEVKITVYGHSPHFSHVLCLCAKMSRFASTMNQKWHILFKSMLYYIILLSSYEAIL